MSFMVVSVPVGQGLCVCQMYVVQQANGRTSTEEGPHYNTYGEAARKANEMNVQMVLDLSKLNDDVAEHLYKLRGVLHKPKLELIK